MIGRQHKLQKASSDTSTSKAELNRQAKRNKVAQQSKKASIHTVSRGWKGITRKYL